MQNTLTKNEIRSIVETERKSLRINSIVPFYGTDLNLYVQENYLDGDRYLAFYTDWEQDRYDDKKLENILEPLPEIIQIISDHIAEIKENYIDVAESKLIVSMQDLSEKYVSKLREIFKVENVAIN